MAKNIYNIYNFFYEKKNKNFKKKASLYIHKDIEIFIKNFEKTFVFLAFFYQEKFFFIKNLFK